MAKGGVILPILTEFKPDGIDKAIKEFQKLETTTQKIGFGLEKAFVPAIAALGGLTVAAVSFARAAAEDQASAEKLAGSLRRTTDATDAQIASISDYIDKMQLATNIADTELREAFSRLAVATGDVTKSQELLQLASDISVATGRDLASVTDALAKAYNGNFKALQQLDPSLRAAIRSGEDFDTIGQRLAETYGGAAADATQTAEGQMKNLAIQLDEAGEAIGELILPIMQTLLPALQNAAEFAQDNAEVMVALAAAVGAVSGAIVIANVAMKTYAGLQAVVKVANTVLGTSFKLTTTNLMKATGAMGAVGAALALGTIAYQVYTDRKKEAEQTTKDLAAALFLEGEAQQQALSDLAANNDAVRRFLAAVESLGVGMGDVTEFVADGTGALSDLVPAIEGVVTQVKGTNPELAALAKQFLGVTTQSDDLNQAYGELTREQVLAAVAIRDFVPEIRRLQGEEENRASATSLVANVTRDMTEAQKEAEEAAKDMSTAAQDVSKRLETYRERLTKSLETTQAWRDRLREATQSGAESFNDFTVDAGTSIEKFRQDLLQSAQNAFDWQNNLLRIAQLTSPEFASYLADMGLAGADLVADLANSGDDIQAVFDAFVINQQVMSRDFLRGFDSTAEGVRRRMADIKTAVENSLPPGATMYQKAMAIGDAIYLGIVDALEAGEDNVAWAAAALADTAIWAGKNAIDARSPSRMAASEIGEPISEGIAMGLESSAHVAADAMTDVMGQVSKIGVEEAKKIVTEIEDQIDAIFDGIGARRSEEQMVKRVTDAETELTDAKKDLARITRGAGKNSEEYAEALRKVQDAEWSLADARDRQVDAQHRVSKAQIGINEALTEFGFGSPQWTEAVRQLEKENRSLEQAARNVTDREGELTAARDTAQSVLKGYTKDSDEYRAAVERVQKAELDARDANTELLKSRSDLIAQGPKGEEMFRNLAASAGLERDEIDRLVVSYQNLNTARQIASQAPVVPAPPPVKSTPSPVRAPSANRTPAPTIIPARPRVGGGGTQRYMNLGGPVPGIQNLSTPIMAHGGEFVLSADVVDAIKRGAPTRGLGAGSGTGSGGGNVINITVTSADPQAVVDAIRRYNRTNGPAPIKVSA